MPFQSDCRHAILLVLLVALVADPSAAGVWEGEAPAEPLLNGRLSARREPRPPETEQDSERDVGQDYNGARLEFQALPELPDEIGVAGPIVGVHNGFLIAAGGANFAKPDAPDLWSVPKQYHDRAWVLERAGSGDQATYSWRPEATSFRLTQAVAYSAVVSTSEGIVCLGGENESGPTNRAFLLTWQSGPDGTWQLLENDRIVPDLPAPCTSGGAAVIGDFVYFLGAAAPVAGTQPVQVLWRLNLNVLKGASAKIDAEIKTPWQRVATWSDDQPARTHALVTAQHDGFADRLYAIGGRYFRDPTQTADLDKLVFLDEVWSLDPSDFDPDRYDAASNVYNHKNPWRRQADAPHPLSAGTALPFGPAHVIVPAFASGEQVKQSLEQRVEMSDFDHPGFPLRALAYHTVTDTWADMGPTPANQVTTPGVTWGRDLVLISGEIRPRVRTRANWLISVPGREFAFGAVNMTVLVAYLAAMLAVGAYFTFRNRSTDDYFRGGKHIPWFVAGCSIYATMLSSITYMAIPAKAFAQDWLYAFGMLMILAAAPIAVYVAMPFFRYIDATSAYEYLEKRFSRGVRMIGSGSFTLFHVFRMGVVMALAALALASVTPLDPSQCVIVMGILSIIYCTLGGIEAVVWTDTVQTFVLLGGALICLIVALSGTESGSLQAAIDSRKFHFVDLDLNPAHFTSMTLLVVVLGGFGQNLASYTSDQAVVQRYVTTSSKQQAARAIWLNGVMTVPAGLIFFGMGTAFWMFYRSHPERLDPSIAADGIMPLFISQELPVGLAGLVVAGIFAAAQSTVSTSMNSGATTLVTDFLRPLQLGRSETGYLWLARLMTLTMGVLGTLAGLLFVNPDIKSLFDHYISLLGLSLGVLAGIFVLGATTRRASAAGSLIGAVVAMCSMAIVFLAGQDQSVLGINLRDITPSIFGAPLYQMHAYLYAFAGITICYVVGYAASWFTPQDEKLLIGLTLWDRRRG